MVHEDKTSGCGLANQQRVSALICSFYWRHSFVASVTSAMSGYIELGSKASLPCAVQTLPAKLPSARIQIMIELLQVVYVDKEAEHFWRELDVYLKQAARATEAPMKAFAHLPMPLLVFFC